MHYIQISLNTLALFTVNSLGGERLVAMGLSYRCDLILELRIFSLEGKYSIKIFY